jgi:hypothetical protein
MAIAVPDGVILQHELTRHRRIRAERRFRRSIELVIAEGADRSGRPTSIRVGRLPFGSATRSM